jgi:hypothetical protein
VRLLRGWRAPALGALVIIVAVGAYLAIHKSGEHDGEPQAEADAGEGLVIKDPVKRRYVERTDEVCRQAAADWDRAAEQVFGKSRPTVAKPSQLRVYVRLTIPPLRRQIAELRQLPDRPPGDESKLNAIYARMEVALRALERAARHPDAPGAVSALDTAGNLRNEQALAYGMDACGQED